MKLLFTLIIVLLPVICFSQKDTIKLTKLREQITLLSAKVDKIDRDQNNYSIEKDLLKETYSSNYATVNLLVTAILGIFAVLTFFGTRDINSIKKEYKEELEKLRHLQNEVEIKSKEFDITKKRYDEEINKILKQNEDQNQKIKVLEIKERVTELIKEEQFITALEFCNVGLEISPDDEVLQVEKGRILSRLRQYKQAIETYERVLGINDSNSPTITNLTELYYFTNQIDKAEKIIEKHKNLFTNKKVDLLKFFDCIRKYHLNDIVAMKENIKEILTEKDVIKDTRNGSWDFAEAVIFVSNEPSDERMIVLSTLVLYLNGNMKDIEVDKTLSLGIFT